MSCAIRNLENPVGALLKVSPFKHEAFSRMQGFFFLVGVSTINFAVIVFFPELGLRGRASSRAAYKSHPWMADPNLNYALNSNLNNRNQTQPFNWWILLGGLVHGFRAKKEGREEKKAISANFAHRCLSGNSDTVLFPLQMRRNERERYLDALFKSSRVVTAGRVKLSINKGGKSSNGVQICSDEGHRARGVCLQVLD